MRDAGNEIRDAGFKNYLLAWELWLHFETKIEVRDELQEDGNMENCKRCEC